MRLIRHPLIGSLLIEKPRVNTRLQAFSLQIPENLRRFLKDSLVYARIFDCLFNRLCIFGGHSRRVRLAVTTLYLCITLFIGFKLHILREKFR